MAFAAGTVIDRYEIVKVLGEGGFATVYLARHQALGNEFALKLLNSEWATQGDVLFRFLEEGRIQANLKHPSIVQVSEIVSSPPGLVMELVRGGSLRNILERERRIPPEQAAQYLLPVLDAVAFAHRANVVHRDLKPENILLDVVAGREVPKVADFGIAKLRSSDGAARSTRTRVGAKMGTTLYMSPEQVRAEADIDGRSDVFALGVVLYELLVGHTPFEDADDGAIAARIVEGRFDGAAQLDAVHRRMADVVRRALRPAREDRFETCEAMRAALGQALETRRVVSADVTARVADEGSGAELTVFPLPVLHPALTAAHAPVVRDVVLRNGGGLRLPPGELRFELTTGPDAAPLVSQALAVPAVDAGDECCLGAVALELPGLTDLGAHELTLRWALRSGGGAPIVAGQIQLPLFEAARWPGPSVSPEELLAWFVDTGHPVVRVLAARVRERLRSVTGSSDRYGYAGRSRARVREAMSALVEVVRPLGALNRPTEDLLARPVLVRSPDRALAEGPLAVEAVLLMAAALEQLGLHPVLAVTAAGLWPGLWLSDERFPEGVVEDEERVAAELDRGALVFIDPRDGALVRGSSGLQGTGFVWALDVAVARATFPPRPAAGVIGASSATGEVARLLGQAESEPAGPEPVAEPLPEGVAERFQRWQDRLLDLSLRNRLLNFRRGGSGALQLAVSDLGAFEDRLSAQERFTVEPCEGEAPSPRGPSLQLGALGTDEEVDRRLRKLEQQARVDLDEGGARTLFVAIGLLGWRPDEADDERFAPLLLYPVELRIDRRAGVATLCAVPEDPIANVTLVEKLRRDFGIELTALSALEPDESGLHVDAVLDGVAQAVAEQEGWRVLREVHLGSFSFTKFLMWRDLAENRHAFCRNEAVRLIASKDDPAAPARPAELVEAVEAEAPPCVLDADSTQLDAVAAAVRQESFVLQGPPGTGKSQTIANLVAATLSSGRSVLFVSEKMAALDVVHRRLVQVGLGDFCLELHSHKASKREVLDQLGAVLERERSGVPSSWDRLGQDLGNLRVRLDGYVEALHRERPLGLSFRDAQARLLALGPGGEVAVGLSGLEVLEADRWARLREQVTEFARRASAVSPVHAHPWRASGRTGWSAADEQRLMERLEAGLRAADEVDAAAVGLEAQVGPAAESSTELLGAAAELGTVIASGATPASALAATWPATRQRTRTYVEARCGDASRRAELGKRWKVDLLEADLSRPLAALERWASAFFLIAFFALFMTRRRLRAHSLGKMGRNSGVLEDLRTARQCQDAAAQLAAEREEARGAIGWDGDVEDTSDLMARVARGDQAQAVLERVAGLRPERWGGVLAGPGVGLGSRARSLAEAVAALATIEQQVAELAGCTAAEGWAAPSAAGHRTLMRSRFKGWLQARSAFRPWCQYRAAARQIEAAGVPGLVREHVSGALGADEAVFAFERGFLRAWCQATLDAEPLLREFDGDGQHRAVADFRDRDRALIKTTRRWIAARLEERIPRPSESGTDRGEMGILRRELVKKARHKPVRKLLAELPTLLPRLKPCLLMSPLSVAQYLPATERPFDLVVFDEASQIGTHDAIGAIARGRRVVIVGDSKQLPPTNFFNRSVDDDAAADENDVAELESVLDEAIAKQLPQRWLGWHYRSRHEALIEFSNQSFYGGRLNVFPAARRQVDELGVKWHPVPDGVYLPGTARKNGRTNIVEAKALVAHLVRELKAHPPLRRTFGVVTFSQAQQALILELLESARATSAKVEAHFQHGDEPLFVKNLENVQGDERDEIYFSVGYARDAEGHLNHRFGPLSMAGGERRLNVAITRARQQLRVFTTLMPEHIDPSRAHSVGAQRLRGFLEYARRSENVGRGVGAGEEGSAFEDALQRVVEAAGHRVRRTVGCGGYRVDVAVESRERPGVFVLGVESDGDSYRTARTARDRDRLRADVLGSLGWRLHRVWSPDWIFDPQGQARRLLEALAEAEREGPPNAGPAPTAEAEALKETEVGSAPLEPELDVEVVQYVDVEVPAVSDEPAALERPDTGRRVAELLQALVAGEGPIEAEWTVRRVATAFGVRRLTERLRKLIETPLRQEIRKGRIVERDGFLWPTGIDPAGYRRWRSQDEEGRTLTIEAMALEEVANATAVLLARRVMIHQEDLAREVLRACQASSSRSGLARALEAIALLEQQGRCVVQEENVAWIPPSARS